jgi:hypothetical protein
VLFRAALVGIDRLGHAIAIRPPQDDFHHVAVAFLLPRQFLRSEDRGTWSANGAERLPL